MLALLVLVQPIARLFQEVWLHIPLPCCLKSVHYVSVDQGSPTLLKLRATSLVPINAKGY